MRPPPPVHLTADGRIVTPPALLAALERRALVARAVEEARS